MGEPKWTPGPWHWYVEDGSFMGLSGPDGQYDHILWSEICPACQKRGNRCTAPNDPNAHLIAAAPELYEALRDIVSIMPAYWDKIPDAIRRKAERGVVALAKARGEDAG